MKDEKCIDMYFCKRKIKQYGTKMKKVYFYSLVTLVRSVNELYIFPTIESNLI